MDLGLISVRYARALLKAGIEAKEAEKVYADMQTLAQNYSQMPALRITIDNPMLSNAQKESLLLLATGGEPCELTKRFVALVLKEDRESIMQFIANSFTSSTVPTSSNCWLLLIPFSCSRRTCDTSLGFILSDIILCFIC